MTHRDGKPAHEHSERVAMRMYPDKILMAIAYLHDVLEDTHVTEAQLRHVFGSRITDAVVALTREDGETWSQYMEKVSRNADAVVVKIADIEDNISRCVPTDKMHAKLPMYREALRDLRAKSF